MDIEVRVCYNCGKFRKERVGMPKFFVSGEQVDSGRIRIIGDDVNHIKNVLRMKVDDVFNVCDRDSKINYKVKIDMFEQNEIICDIIDTYENSVESNVKVHIYQGLPKADKMELIIQKCVELGVGEITPVDMKRCVVKLNDKDKVKKIDRWNKIAEVAAKQSGRDIVPRVCNVKNVNDICLEFSNYDVVILCYENEEKLLLKDVFKGLYETKITSEDMLNGELKIAVIIGPEGGVDVSEVKYMEQHGAKVVSLGKRILRTETVAISLLSIIMYEFERNEK